MPVGLMIQVLLQSILAAQFLGHLEMILLILHYYTPLRFHTIFRIHPCLPAAFDSTQEVE